MPDVTPILDSPETDIALAGNAPLLLDDPGALYLVTAGAADLFARRLRDGREVRGAHVARVEAGGIVLCPLAPDAPEGQSAKGLVAVGGPGSRVRPCRLQTLWSALADPARQAGAARLLDDWVLALAEATGPFPAFPGQGRELTPGPGPLEVAEGEVLSVQHRPLWLELAAGTFRLQGREDLPEIAPGPTMPLPPRTWLAACTPGRLGRIAPVEALEPAVLIQGLEAYHRCLLVCLERQAALAEADERRRFARRQAGDAGRLDQSGRRFLTIFTPRQREVLAETTSPDPLMRACSLVGRAAGIAMRQPPGDDPGAPLDGRVRDMARASGCRMRAVALAGDWWRRDNGPLLGFSADGGAPVALLPQSPRRYLAVDPSRDAATAVDAKAAADLAPRAVMFYRPFPEGGVSLAGLLRLSLRGCGRDFASVALTAALGALLSLLAPIMTGHVINSVIPQAARTELLQITLMLFGCAVAAGLFNITKGFALVRLEGRMDIAAQAALWDRLLALPVPFFKDYTAGDLANRSLGIQAMREIVSGMTINAVISFVFSSFSLVLLFYYDPGLALLALVLVACGTAMAGLLGAALVKSQRAIYAIQGRLQGLILQFVTGIEKLRVGGAETRAYAVWARQFAAKKEAAYSAGLLRAGLDTFNAVFPVLTMAAIFSWYFTYRLHLLAVGDFMAFSAAYATFQSAMLQMILVLSSTLQILPLYDRLRPILAATPESDAAKTRPEALDGRIEVSHLAFRYAENTPMILKDVSLTVKPGQFTAIVGWSGSGKSTLLRLLLGFETPTSGGIYYSGMLLDTLDLRELRQQIGVVLQDGKLLTGSLQSNILGESGLPVDAAWEAAAMVGLADDVKAMPMGMQTVVSPGGGNLSGGQKQRVLIARAIVRRPRILFFDEATSALDNRTQAMVTRSLDSLSVSRVVIAHRLTTIEHADAVHLLHDGVIAESGTMEELMRQKGLFYELGRRQVV